MFLTFCSRGTWRMYTYGKGFFFGSKPAFTTASAWWRHRHGGAATARSCRSKTWKTSVALLSIIRFKNSLTRLQQLSGGCESGHIFRSFSFSFSFLSDNDTANSSELNASSLSGGEISGIVFGSVGLIFVACFYVRYQRGGQGAQAHAAAADAGAAADPGDAPPPAAVVSEAEMAELRPHDDPPPYEHEDADAPPLHAVEREDCVNKDADAASVMLGDISGLGGDPLVSMDKGSNHIVHGATQPDAPPDSDLGPEVRVTIDGGLDEEKKQGQKPVDIKNADGSHKLISLEKGCVASGEATQSATDLLSTDTPISALSMEPLPPTPIMSAVVAVDIGGKEADRHRRRRPSQSDSESSSERTASSPSSASSISDGGEDFDMLTPLEASVFVVKSTETGEEETPTPMSVAAKRRVRVLWMAK